MKTAKIGLLGFGNVGGGTYHILTENKKISPTYFVELIFIRNNFIKLVIAI